MEGAVNADLEAVVAVTLRGPSGRSHLIEAVVDTGYSEFLTLPSAHVSELGLRYKNRGTATLADGTGVDFDVYDAEMVWDGQLIAIPVDESETTPLMGMSLLEGHEVRIEARSGGRVLIEAFDG